MQAEKAQLSEPLEVKPEIFFGGSSQKGLEVAARRVSVYLTWGEPPAQAGEKIARVKSLAEAEGRTLEYGIRLHAISRDTSEAAWAEAQRLLDSFSEEEVAQAQQGLARSQSEGHKRMNELHGHGQDFSAGNSARSLEIYPGLWSGVGLVRGGAGTALVGSHEEVANLIEEYEQQGFRYFVLSGYPHLEETFSVGEGVIPALKNRGLTIAHH